MIIKKKSDLTPSRGAVKNLTHTGVCLGKAWLQELPTEMGL